MWKFPERRECRVSPYGHALIGEGDSQRTSLGGSFAMYPERPVVFWQ